jgi:hypothetical protein
MKHILPTIVLLTGLALSAAAAYYSILGLTAIFSGAFWSIVIMGTTLEIAKLVAVSWLYHNWNEAPKLIKTYFMFSIIVLMFITSLGIFGFLSRAHIEQQVKINTGVSSEISILDAKIKLKDDEIKDIDKQIAVIDDSINKMIEKGQAKSSLTANNAQKKNRQDLVKSKTEILEQASPLKIERVKLDAEIQKLEAEVGPIKYVAELIYGESSTEILDKAVRFVIIIIIFVFDPLAVLLLLAFNISMKKKEDYADMEFVEFSEYKPRGRKKKSMKQEEPTTGENTTSTVLPISGGDF